ncbi:MAG TPA: YibE/F family protein [Candidatus Paceibacterota bacterium]|nr:YibE/F family protein [Candidatus Paceibacterota bacterium]
MKKILWVVLVSGLLIAIPATLKADEGVVITLGQITNIVSQKVQDVEGTDVQETVQQLAVKILEGSFKDQIVQVENDITPLKVGDRVNLALSKDEQGNPVINGIGFAGAYRLPTLGWLAALFVLLVLVFGGWQGIRGLTSLVGGLALILFVLLPGLLHGQSPIGLSIGVSALIIIVGSYITHGFNRTTTAAVIGMIATVVVVGFLALYVVHAAHLSGNASEDSLYLTSDTSGQIDLVGLLLGGMLIGLLGVLYDIAIGQAIAVEELRRASHDMHPRRLFQRALRIGREHIGALVNTLAIAYVGVSLPLLLVFYTEHADIWQSMNQEVFATEIVRILIGSIGLVIAVPITTAIAVAMLKDRIFQSSAIETVHQHANTGKT